LKSHQRYSTISIGIFFVVTLGLISFSESAYALENTLTIEASDLTGNSLGQLNELILDGTIIDSGLTPTSYLVTTGVEYTVFVGDFGTFVFDHWEDDSTDPSRIITITEDTTITAFYIDITGDVTALVLPAASIAMKLSVVAAARGIDSK